VVVEDGWGAEHGEQLDGPADDAVDRLRLREYR
jgi:hypothetical protein